MEKIPYEDFKKLDIRVGTILEAESIEGADKLLRLVIDLGDEQRQVLAGIAQFVDGPESIIGKQIPVLVNLEPRVMRGLESDGMILAVSDGEEPILIMPERQVEPGSKVK